MSRYFDHAATTPVKPSAVEVLTTLLPQLANPSSLHRSGREARLAVDSARARLAAAVGADPSEVIFTSGGTEADNLALKGLYWQRRGASSSGGGAPRRRVLLTGIEHHAVLDTAEWLEAHEGAELVIIPVDDEGIVDTAVLAEMLVKDPETIALVTVMWANSEVGTVQPIPEIGRLCAAAGVPLHTDAVQAFGSAPVSFADSQAATMAISGHKIGAPVGVGALLVRRDVKLTPVLHGGGQERDVRSGTLDAPGICAFAAVAEEVAAGRQAEAERLAGLRDRLLEAVIGLEGVALRGPDPRTAPQRRLPNNLHITVDGAEGDSLLFMLDMAGFDTATGSACTAGVPRPSHVLMAMGLTEAEARGAQRFTLGWTTDEDDVAALAGALPGIIARSRSAGLAGGRRG